MAKKISFSDFKRLVDSRTISREMLAEYLEQDPNVSIPKLRFKTEALLDEAPADYSVDDDIYHMLRKRELERRKEKVELFGLRDKPDVVAEGDSWFRHFPIFKPTAIASWIEKNRDIDMDNIARWGDTLTEILTRKQYMTAIDNNDTEFFMLSAGGNDLQDGISRYIHEYDENRPVDEYITEDGVEELNRIKQGYITLLSEVTKTFPNVKILCYGYDYPRPSNGSQYIGKYLEKKGIPENLMKSIVSPLIDQLNDVISEAVSSYQLAIYINCLNATDSFTWDDDMHPDSAGFKELASRFENYIVPAA